MCRATGIWRCDKLSGIAETLGMRTTFCRSQDPSGLKKKEEKGRENDNAVGMCPSGVVAHVF